MLRRLFSIFDPHTMYGIDFNWGFFFFFFYLFTFRVYVKKRGIFLALKRVRRFVISDLSSTMGKISFVVVFFYRIFILLSVSNFLGLIPYIFPVTRHLSLILSLSFIFWVSLFVVTLAYNFTSLIRHLVPEGTPYALIILMVLIETLRYLIRPLTLSIRLTANMIAGHLLVVLLRTFLCKIRYLGKGFLFLGGVGLTLLERIVIFIQAYVFTVLLSLYFAD